MGAARRVEIKGGGTPNSFFAIDAYRRAEEPTKVAAPNAGIPRRQSGGKRKSNLGNQKKYRRREPNPTRQQNIGPKLTKGAKG